MLAGPKRVSYHYGYPKYKISKLESDINDDALKIKFYVYDVFMICSKHGTLSPDNLKCDVCSCSNYEQDMKNQRS